MRARHAFLSTLAVLGLATAASSQVATFTRIPRSSAATDITPDGSIVVGVGTDPDDPYVTGSFIWSWRVDATPTFIPGGRAVAVSADGQTIAGVIKDPATDRGVAAIWTQQTQAWQSLGWLPNALIGCGDLSSPSDISPDGSTVIGLSWDGCDGTAFRWTQATGMVPQESLGNGGNRASAISPSGHLAGFAQGSTNRTPALWGPDGTGVVFDMDDRGELLGFSFDNDTVLGTIDGEAVYGDYAGNFTSIGNLKPGWTGTAKCATIEGNRIVGYDNLMLGVEGWVWAPGSGIRSLVDLLNDLGTTEDAFGNPTVIPASMGAPTAITPNGAIIVGATLGSFGDAGGGWIVEMPPSSVAETYGCGLNPPGSLTVVSGSPTLGNPTTFRLDNPLGTQASGLAFLSISGKSFPGLFPCGAPLAGFGMDAGQGFVGELLINVPVIQTKPAAGAVWANGSPARISWTIPDNMALLGLKFYTQGVILDFGLNRIGLTEAALLFVGV